MVEDTIAAISTPLGEGGISIVRISGAEAFHIAERIYRGNAHPSDVPSHRVLHGHLRDPVTGSLVDEVLLVVMRAPNTYTAEDVVEINCHGGILVTRSILEIVLHCGARLAEPGEFTRRAFLNGRIDLAQAEAVLDIIRSQTPAGLGRSLEQLGGGLSKRIEALRKMLIDVLAQLEVAVDFSDGEAQTFEPDQLKSAVMDVLRSVEELIETSQAGRLLREGASLAIVGKANVGKSSLLNALLMEDRAIVSPLPGTTRDTIEEWLNISGFPVKVIDTAGLGSSQCEVSREGERRTKERLMAADLVLFVLDGSEPLDHRDEEIARILDRKPKLTLVNKNDLKERIDIARVKELSGGPILRISALKNVGLEELRSAVVEHLMGGHDAPVEGIIITHVRHKNVLVRTREALCQGVEAIEKGLSEELVAVDIREALSILGEITGETTTEEVLDIIFTNFCIGK